MPIIKDTINLNDYEIDEDGTVKSGPPYYLNGERYKVLKIELEPKNLPLNSSNIQLNGKFNIEIERE